jgi:putative mRNA 3-end processing factor
MKSRRLIIAPIIVDRDQQPGAGDWAKRSGEHGRLSSEAPVLIESADGLYCPDGGFHVDPWGTVPRAVITHAHGDHARPGSAAYLCSEACAPLLARRFDDGTPIETLPYGRRIRIGEVTVSLHPAGHVLGSAQVRIEGRGGIWVVSGDYKRAADPTCAPFEPVACDTFITECTFALPIYRWDPTAAVIDDLAAWRRANAGHGLASVVFCYTIGKAQRLLAELHGVADAPIWVHGALLPMIEAYRRAGVVLPPVQTVIDRPRGTSFAGALILAPPSARGTPWMRRLGRFSDGLASGLMRVRGVRRQRAYDRGFVLSDHADWPALLATVRETGASRVVATHGHAEALARYLGEAGLETSVMRTAWEGEAGSDDSA